VWGSSPRTRDRARFWGYKKSPQVYAWGALHVLDEGPCPRATSTIGHHGGVSQGPDGVRAIIENLSDARIAPYVHAANGDDDFAIELYLWNHRMASALHTGLGLTEVILRNAIDRELRKWNALQKRPDGSFYTEFWLTEGTARPLNNMISEGRKKAVHNAYRARASRPVNHPRKRAPISHDDVLAQMSFGTMVRLLPDKSARDSARTVRDIMWDEPVEITQRTASTTAVNLRCAAS